MAKKVSKANTVETVPSEDENWGWWSCFKSQEDWLKSCGIPIPDHNVLNDTSNLFELLQKFGGYLAFLEAEVGSLAGQRNALKGVYESAVQVRTVEFSGSEKSKEAKVLVAHEMIRRTRRMWVEADMLYETAKGMLASYVRAWETVSRLVTVQSIESNTQPRRVP